jgi:hypothetical protein
MGKQEPRLSQDVLLGIMLEAYLLGMRQKDVGPRAIIDRLSAELRPYFSREERTPRSDHSTTNSRQEAIG